MSSTIGYVESWLNRLRDRVFEQFKGLPKIDAIVQALAKQAQDLEESGQALLLLRSIDDCTGAQLRILGNLVGQPYAGEDEATFRLYLRARIAANKSDGNPEALYRVLRAMLGGGTSVRLNLQRSPIKSFLLTVSSPPMTETQGQVGVSLLRDAKEVADRGLLAWQGDVDSEMLTTSLACYSTGITSIGDSNIDVDDSSAFPDTGTIIIDEGTADEETVAYTRHDGASIFVSGSLAKAHSVNSVVALVGSVGKGLPVSTWMTAGGAIGDPSFSIDDDTGFTAGDVLIIDEGTADEETCTLSSISAGSFFITPDLTRNHGTGATVVKVGSGGKLASIAQA